MLHAFAKVAIAPAVANDTSEQRGKDCLVWQTTFRVGSIQSRRMRAALVLRQTNVPLPHERCIPFTTRPNQRSSGHKTHQTDKTSSSSLRSLVYKSSLVADNSGVSRRGLSLIPKIGIGHNRRSKKFAIKLKTNMI
jgi:hypothetical protein